MGQKCWGMKGQTEGWSDVRLGQVSQVLRMFNPKVFALGCISYNFDEVIFCYFRQVALDVLTSSCSNIEIFIW